ncbi:MAG: radical SAM protein [Lachnospiraceae bacterium]|nr:radical SAM protein [Lachnospiraceae bacterium]
MKRFVRYQNGNYTVTLDTLTGTKIRENDLDFFEADTVESMDIKITNYCDMGCPMCHENSTTEGKHADILGPSFLDRLHPYTELALGGGNPLSHPDLYEFLQRCKEREFIPSMTVNQTHFLKHYDLIKQLVNEKLIYGLGISLGNPTDEFIAKVKTIPNAVIHIINGLVSLEQLHKLKDKDLKVLILGYKVFRRGEALYDQEGLLIEMRKTRMYQTLPQMVEENWFKVLSFDNLAIEQLDPKRLMEEDEWNEFYMGDDGIGDGFTSASMYVDMVERKYAKNSCSIERFDLLPTIEEMYKSLK